MKTSQIPLASICALSAFGFTPHPPKPPAIERLANVNSPHQAEALKSRVADYSGASAVSSARISAAVREDRLKTLIPLQRPMHANTRKILNLSSPFGLNGPQPEDVVQGQSGDCYLLAVLAAIAKHQPETLIDSLLEIDAGNEMHIIQYKDMVNGNTLNSLVFDTSYVDGDNTPLYAGDQTDKTIIEIAPKHPGNGDSTPRPSEPAPAPAGEIVSLSRPTLSPAVQNALSPQKVSWVKLYENWFTEMNERYQLLNSKTGFEGISNGGWAAIPFKLLTGKDMDILAPRSLGEFQQLMTQAEEGKIVILISNSKTFSEHYFPGTHAYAVLGHEERSSDIYNPHGRRTKMDDKILFDNTIRVVVERSEPQNLTT
jgi:hypothetical protein